METTELIKKIEEIEKQYPREQGDIAYNAYYTLT